MVLDTNAQDEVRSWVWSYRSHSSVVFRVYYCCIRRQWNWYTSTYTYCYYRSGSSASKSNSVTRYTHSCTNAATHSNAYTYTSSKANTRSYACCTANTTSSAAKTYTKALPGSKWKSLVL